MRGGIIAAAVAAVAKVLRLGNSGPGNTTQTGFYAYFDTGNVAAANGTLTEVQVEIPTAGIASYYILVGYFSSSNILLRSVAGPFTAAPAGSPYVDTRTVSLAMQTNDIIGIHTGTGATVRWKTSGSYAVYGASTTPSPGNTFDSTFLSYGTGAPIAAGFS